MGRVQVGEHTFEVEVAQTPDQQRQGLAGRTNLESERGMLFPYEPAVERTFWMKGMRMEIDLLWIREGRVTGIEERMQPDDGDKHYASPGPVEYVLEVAAGTVERLDLQVGASVVIEESTPGI